MTGRFPPQACWCTDAPCEDTLKTALILGHPGHELRVFRFLELHRPVVYVLTDGSGNNQGESRIASTVKVLEATGCTAGRVFRRFTDREFYEILLNGNESALTNVMKDMIADLKQRGVERLVGDACEGFNPTHDVCRYMINLMAKRLGLPNYDFLLEGSPLSCPEGLKDKCLLFHLTDEDFERKLAAAQNYPELKFDLEETLKKYGKAPFKVECLRPVDGLPALKTWETPLPFYETYALQKIEQGKYREVISFEKQIRPLVEAIYAHPDYQ
jgi:hypothetical protein